ncbi:MAG: flagellar protein FlaG [Rhodocyclaceae bacterium]|nr:flagellar protein FlaG [Rhodocyclaceae bacterium]
MNISSLSNYSPPAAAAPTASIEARAARAPSDSAATPVQTAQAVTSTSKAEATRQEVEDAVKSVNDFLKPINDSIRFSVDDETGISVIKVIDLTTKDVIRQFPSEEMLSIAKAIDQMKGLLVQQKV